jgi:RNA polymerase sigma-70 factor (sigma-E family)
MTDDAIPLTGATAPRRLDAIYADDGFAALYRETFPRMWRLAFLLLGDRHVAEEVVQDAYARVLERWRSLDEPAAYLRTAVVNRSRDVLRRRQLLGRLALVARRGEVDPTPDPLWDALGHLPAAQRTALVLRFYEDLPVREVAALMDVREGTVKSLVHRGLARLREEIQP